MELPLLIILILFSAFFSGSETAFVSLDKIKLRKIEELRTPSSKRVLALLSDPYKLLVTILIGNTLVNTAASSVVAKLFLGAFGEKGLGISIAVMTIGILILGEVTPKMFALAHPEKVSYLSSFFLGWIERLFAPVRFILIKIAGFIVTALGFRMSHEKHKITEQEIRSMFSLGSKKGLVKESEKDMVESILELKELNAADIMTPRIEMAALDLTRTREELVSQIKETQFARFPVYLHTLDNIVGIIRSKDLLLNEKADIRDIVEKPFFAPESMRIYDLLRALQKWHSHVAVVTDEYGVTSGIVTVEDILEEIVGEIRDEFDFEAPDIRKLDKNNYEISGQAHIDEVNEKLDLAIDTEEVDTIGGYVTLLIGKMPRAGNQVKIGNFIFEVNDVSKNRITSLTVYRDKGEN